MPTRAAIAADSPLTVSAGARIAASGGNAADIAVAAALAASLAEILMCSLGVAAFVMLQRADGAAELIDGADAVPTGHLRGRLRPKACWQVDLPYGDGITVRAGPAAVAVPGALAALELAWRRHGSLPWREVVAPALQLAREGFPLGRTTAVWLQMAGPLLFHRQAASRACFQPDPADPPRADQCFRVPDMAATLELIAEEGAGAFYRGDLSAAFARAMADEGGLVTRQDLAAYRAEVRAPLRLRSHGFALALNPAPAVGGIALSYLIERQDRELLSAAGPRGTRLAAAERARRLARAQHHLCELHRRQRPPGLASPSTTHLSVATVDGALVAITLSNGYGSGITIPGTGIACNNSLGEPELNPGGYLVASPGSRLVSNMAPTLARHPDGRAIAFGTPGASRITTALAQMWQAYTGDVLPLEQAIAAPRLHVDADKQPPVLLCEPGVDTRLLEPDYVIRRFESRDMFFGGIKLAGSEATGELHAIADLRREGATVITVG